MYFTRLFILIEYSNGTINQANVIVSDDHGRTWKPGGSIRYGEHQATGNSIHSNEATVRHNTSGGGLGMGWLWYIGVI